MASSSTRGGIGWTLGKMSSGKVLPSLTQLSRALMVSQFLEGFKNCVDMAPGNMGQCWLWQCWGIFELDDLRGLFQSQQFWFFSPKTLASNLWIQTLFPKKKRHIIEYFIAVFLSHSPILEATSANPLRIVSFRLSKGPPVSYRVGVGTIPAFFFCFHPSAPAWQPAKIHI